MNSYCPSCGSQLPPDASFCPSCGTAVAQQISGATPPAQPAASSTGEQVKARICHECGAVNAPDAETCTVCGEMLRAEPVVEHLAAAPVTHAAADRKASSPTWIYLIAGAGVLAVAAAIYLLTAPDPIPPMAQAPQPAAGQEGNLPPGHPPMNPGPTPEQQKMIEDLKAKVAANPSDDSSRLQLAHLYYDTDQHGESLSLYRDYVSRNPTDFNARTDMAYSMYQTGDLEGAITELKEITSKDTRHQNAAYNLAMMYVVKRDRDSVQLWMDRVIAIDSTTTQARNAREIIQALSEAHGE